MRDEAFNLFLIAVIVTATKSILVINALPKCKQNTITVKDPYHQCIPCSPCPEGQELYPPCGSQITEQERGSIECKNCKPGHYSNKMDIYPCKECHNCLNNQIERKKCTNTSDTICNTSCNNGYYFENSSLDCQRCSCCCGDAKDEKIKKCSSDGEPESNQCSSHRAQKCCKATLQSTVASEQPTAIGAPAVEKTVSVWKITSIVLGSIAGLALLVLTIMCRRKFFACCTSTDVAIGSETQNDKTKKMRQSNIELSTPSTPNGATTSQDEPIGIIANTDNTNQNRLSKSGYDVSTPGTSTDFRQTESTNQNRLSNIGYDVSTPGTSNECRQIDDTYQNRLSNTGYDVSTPGTPNEFRKTILQKADSSYKMSKKHEPQLQRQAKTLERQVSADSNSSAHGEPQHQSKRQSKMLGRQGSTESNSSDSEKTGRRYTRSGSILSLKDAVTRKLSLRQNSDDTEILVPMESDVHLPENKWFKLGDLNLVVREQFGKMLDDQTYGVGNTKKLATLYKMDKYDIEKLLKESNPGEQLLKYINVKFPNKTVYEFCKELQRPGIERNDIVDELCSYLHKVDQEPPSSSETHSSN